MRKLLLLLMVLTLGVSLCHEAWAQSIPYKPGRLSWKVSGGEIVLVTARYTNRNSFDNRVYTFYFEPEDRSQLFIVPMVGEKPGSVTFSTVSSSGGDWIFSDIAILKQGSEIYLLRARQETPGGWSEPGDLTVERFKLKKGDDEELPYHFAHHGKTIKPNAPRVSVDEVLKQQFKATIR